MIIIINIRRNKENILLGVCIVFSMIFIGFFTNGMLDLYNTYNQKADATDAHAIYFDIETDDIIDFSFMKKIADVDYVLMLKDSEDQPVFNVIYENKYFELQSGRNFKKEDFFNNEKTAIVGCNADEIAVIDPLTINQKEYQIIGSLKESAELSSRFAIYYCKGSSTNINPNEIFIIEADSNKNAEKVYQAIVLYMQGKSYTVNQKDIKVATVENMAEINEKWFILGFFSIILYFVSNITVLFFWLNGFEDTYKVYKLLGITSIKKTILVSLIKVFSLFYLFGMIIILFMFFTDMQLWVFMILLYIPLLLIDIISVLFEFEIIVTREWERGIKIE